jgi:thiamine-phosphate pyrophosphorylase
MQLIVITQPFFFDGEAESINRLFLCGLQRLHLRKPDASTEEIEKLLQQINPEFYSKISIHDQFDLAEQFDLGGVHFTFRSRQQLEDEFPGRRKSTGCHSLAELTDIEGKVGYAFLSPVFNSISKAGYNASFDLGELKNWLAQPRKLDVIALGGITPANIGIVKSLGFDGVAVLGSVWQNDDPVVQFLELQKQIK